MGQKAFDKYRHEYPSVDMTRRGGILQLTLHTNGASLSWGPETKLELTEMFADVGNDLENRVVILTGSADSFIKPGFVEKPAEASGNIRTEQWGSRNLPDGKKLLARQLEINAPMIAAVNGPATIHGEIALLCDVVLAAESASFQDSQHFTKGVLPGDGAHIVWPMLLGLNRARHFLLTGHTITAAQALELGLVAETMSRERLLERAWTLAEEIAQRPPVALRLFREAMLQPLKRQIANDLGYGLALEGLAAATHWPF